MRDGKLTKVPYSATTDTLASTTNLLTWADFETAWGAYEDSDGSYAGIGFVLSSGDPYTFIDLDNCRRPSGEVAPWAQRVIDRVQAGYLEVSVSQEGVHVIIKARLRGSKTQKKIGRGKIEMYEQKRFVAVTGVAL